MGGRMIAMSLRCGPGMLVALMAALVWAEEAAAPPEYPDHSKLLVWRDEKGAEHPVKTVADWEKRRAHILLGMQQAMGPMPADDRKVPLDFKFELIGGNDTPKYSLRKGSFAAEAGDRVPVYLFVPNGLKGKAPAMLCLHQTTAIGKGEPAGLGGLKTLHYAKELAERGYVCLVPDYPSFGDYKYDFDKAYADKKYGSGSMKGIWNHTRAVDVLESLENVDTTRMGVIGHSLGGHNSLFVAAFDNRLKAVITSCGFTPFSDYYKGNVKGWTSNRYMPRISTVYGNDAKKIPFDFYEVLGAIAPRGIFICAPIGDSNFEVNGVKKCVAAVKEVYELYGRKDQPMAVYPNAGHSFPDEVREQAYRWLDGELKVER